MDELDVQSSIGSETDFFLDQAPDQGRDGQA